jgi:MioC protein
MQLDLTNQVGTMTGTAQLVAQELELTLDDEHTRVQVRLMDGLDAGVFDGGGLFLICTSTYGQGDVPDNAKGLRPCRQRVRFIRYGIIALGDRTYAETFCNGEAFDAIFRTWSHTHGEPLLHDASAGTLPEEAAVQWAGPWIERCRETLTLAA